MKRPAFWAGCAVIFGEILGFLLYEQRQIAYLMMFIYMLMILIFIKFKATYKTKQDYKTKYKRKYIKAEKHTDKRCRIWHYFVCFSAFLLSGICASVYAQNLQHEQVNLQNKMPGEFMGTVKSVKTTTNGWQWIVKADIGKKGTDQTLEVVVNISVKVNEAKEDNAKTKEIRKDDINPDSINPDSINPDSINPDSTKTGLIQILPGDVLVFKGQLKLFEHATNPGCYDAFDYWRSENIYYCLQLSDMKDIQIVRQSQNIVIRWAAKLKQRMSEVITACLEKTDAGIIEALVLGDSSDMDKDVKSLYQQQGIAHIFAISALHMNIVGAGLYQLLKRLGIKWCLSALIAESLLIFYALICGFSVSAIRALVMFTLTIYAECIGRTSDTLTNMMLALIGLIVHQPFLLTNFSFWMSFGCVFSLCLISMKHKYEFRESKADVIKRKNSRKNKQIKNNGEFQVQLVRKCIEDALLLYLFNLPILAWFQYAVPGYSWCLNLLVVPCIGILYPIGLIGSMLGCMQIWLGQYILYACHPVLWLIEAVASAAQKLPLSEIITGRPPMVFVIIAELVWIYQVLLKNLSNRKGRTKRKTKEKIKQRFGGRLILWCVYLFICVPHFLNLSPKNLQIHFLDVGQGDCSLIIHPDNSTMLIDGGSTSQKDVGAYVIEKVLRYYGVQMIDRIVITHMDEDHVNGIETLIEDQYPIGAVYVSEADIQNERLKKLVMQTNQNHISVYAIKQGDILHWGDTEIVCLWPEKESADKQIEDENDCSVVLSMLYKNCRILFTGDISGACEQKLLENENIVKENIDILKVAHHGSKYSTTDTFLTYTRPRLSVISCAENNRYGHPAKETVNRLEQYGAKVYYTMNSGMITMRIAEGKIGVEMYR